MMHAGGRPVPTREEDPLWEYWPRDATGRFLKGKIYEEMAKKNAKKRKSFDVPKARKAARKREDSDGEASYESSGSGSSDGEDSSSGSGSSDGEASYESSGSDYSDGEDSSSGSDFSDGEDSSESDGEARAGAGGGGSGSAWSDSDFSDGEDSSESDGEARAGAGGGGSGSAWSDSDGEGGDSDTDSDSSPKILNLDPNDEKYRTRALDNDHFSKQADNQFQIFWNYHFGGERFEDVKWLPKKLPLGPKLGPLCPPGTGSCQGSMLVKVNKDIAE